MSNPFFFFVLSLFTTRNAHVMQQILRRKKVFAELQEIVEGSFEQDLAAAQKVSLSLSSPSLLSLSCLSLLSLSPVVSVCGVCGCGGWCVCVGAVAPHDRMLTHDRVLTQDKLTLDTKAEVLICEQQSKRCSYGLLSPL